MAREEKWKTQKTEKEVYNLIDRLMGREGPSKFVDMTYKDGIRTMYDWLNGDADLDPMED